MAVHGLGDRTSTDAVIALLSSSLGREKSAAVVLEAAARIGVDESALTLAGAFRILDEIARQGGVVGATARFARARADWTRSLSPPPAGLVPPPPEPRRSEPPRAPAPTLQVREVVTRLSSTVGEDNAREAVDVVSRRLGLDGERLDRAQATALLDELSRGEGLLGATARFMRPKLLLKLG